jgi:hypothetical protein
VAEVGEGGSLKPADAQHQALCVFDSRAGSSQGGEELVHECLELMRSVFGGQREAEVFEVHKQASGYLLTRCTPPNSSPHEYDA